MKPTIAILLAFTLLALASGMPLRSARGASDDDILDYVAGPASAKSKTVARPANGRAVKKACLEAVNICDPNEAEYGSTSGNRPFT